jgi:hypothetical protein
MSLNADFQYIEMNDACRKYFQDQVISVKEPSEKESASREKFEFEADGTCYSFRQHDEQKVPQFEGMVIFQASFPLTSAIMSQFSSEAALLEHIYLKNQLELLGVYYYEHKPEELNEDKRHQIHFRYVCHCKVENLQTLISCIWQDAYGLTSVKSRFFS